MEKNSEVTIKIPCKFSVVGTFVGKRNEWIQKYCSFKSTFVLEREPDNKYDPNAIKVMLSVKKGQHFLHLGYVPAMKAVFLAPLMDKGEDFKVKFAQKLINENKGEITDLILSLNYAE